MRIQSLAREAQKPTPVFLPGESPWTEEPGRSQSIGLQTVRTELTWHISDRNRNPADYLVKKRNSSK